MVGGFIEEQHVGLQHQRFSDGETLAPSTGQSCRQHFAVDEAYATERFRDTSGTFGLGHRGVLHGCFNHGEHGVARGEIGNLRHAREPRALADCHVTGVRIYAACKYLQQSRLARAIRANHANAFAA